MSTRLPPVDMIAWDGQSLIFAPSTDIPATFPELIMAQLTRTFGPKVALGGTTWAQRSTTAAPGAVTRRVDERLGSVNGVRTLFDCSGTSDIDSADSAATIIAAAEAYWTARKSAGFDYVIATTVPDSTNFDGTEDTKRATLNGLILASSVPDAVVDLTVIPELEDATNATYFSDGTHFTAAGAALVVAPGLAAYRTLVPA